MGYLRSFHLVLGNPLISLSLVCVSINYLVTFPHSSACHLLFNTVHPPCLGGSQAATATSHSTPSYNAQTASIIYFTLLYFILLLSSKEIIYNQLLFKLYHYFMIVLHDVGEIALLEEINTPTSRSVSERTNIHIHLFVL